MQTVNLLSSDLLSISAVIIKTNYIGIKRKVKEFFILSLSSSFYTVKKLQAFSY